MSVELVSSAGRFLVQRHTEFVKLFGDVCCLRSELSILFTVFSLSFLFMSLRY